MIPDDKKRVVAQTFTHLFVRYGSGSRYLRRFTNSRAWNLICWILIGLGTLSWIAFLMWKP